MITLTYNGTVLQLPDDLQWVDEHNWVPVEQSIERSTTGGLLIDYATRQGGRNITLQPPDADSAWMPRSTLETLHAWASVAGREMTLGMRGQERTVLFRQLDGALEASPVVFYSTPSPEDWFSATVRLLEK